MSVEERFEGLGLMPFTQERLLLPSCSSRHNPGRATGVQLPSRTQSPLSNIH